VFLPVFVTDCAYFCQKNSWVLKKRTFTAARTRPSFFWRLHQLFFGFTLLVLALSYWTLSGHWLAGFLMLTLPVLLLIHVLLAGFWLIVNPRKAWLSAVILILSFPFWERSYAFKSPSDKAETPSFTVMSYNVASFDVLRYLDGKDQQNAPKAVKWAVEAPADIKCFQEFYNNDKKPIFNTLAQFRAAGYPYKSVLHPEFAQNEQNFFGLTIVSKFPIVKSGEQEFENQNGAVFADIKIGDRMVRVINVHLHSMMLTFTPLRTAYAKKDSEKLKKSSRKVMSQLKTGFVSHAREIKLIEKWIADSPHPVMVCGDFNEMPYGFAYGRVRRRLANAFEEAGKGWGFSFRKTPNFIRIDNQFFDSKQLKVLDFQTRKDVEYSDHYPIFGSYKLL
jgi:endonuclease/exonuclease/phosphatase family metal-dependent hydrolase